jgi:hypothetical protein
MEDLTQKAFRAVEHHPLTLIQSALLVVVLPFTVYYVNNYAPYIHDKKVIDEKFEQQSKRLDRMESILDKMIIIQATDLREKRRK